MSANVELDHQDSVGVARLSGDVDIVQASALRKQLLGAVRNDDLALVVDLTEARYIDSVGVSLLFELAERLTGRQLRFAVVMPAGGLVERVLTIVNLDSVAEVHRDLGEAARRGPRRSLAAAADPGAQAEDSRPGERDADGGDPERQSTRVVVRRLGERDGLGRQRGAAPACVRVRTLGPHASGALASGGAALREGHVVLRSLPAAHGDRRECEAALLRGHGEPPAALASGTPCAA